MVFLAMTSVQGEGPIENSVDNASPERLKNEVEKLKEQLTDPKSPTGDSTVANHAQGIESLPLISVRCRKEIGGNPGKVLTFTWHPNGRWFANTNDTGRLSIWDGFTRTQHIGNQIAKEAILACQFSPSGDALVCGGYDNKCSVVSIRYENELEPPVIKRGLVGTHAGFVSCCKFNHADENQVITCSGDGTCCLWDIEKGQRVLTYQGHTREVLGLDLAPHENGRIFASVGADRLALVWDTRIDKTPVQCYAGHERDINAVRFFPNGDAFVTASDDTTCRLFDRKSEKQIHCYKQKSILFPCNSVDFSLSGRLLFGGYGDHVIHVFDTLKATRETMLLGHESNIACVRISPDGMALGSSSWDGCCKIWA